MTFNIMQTSPIIAETEYSHFEDSATTSMNGSHPVAIRIFTLQSELT